MLNTRNYCRLCLHDNGKKFECSNLIELNEILMDLLGVQILTSEKLSTKICKSCFNKIMDFKAFKSSVIFNQTSLKETQELNAKIMQSKQIKLEDVVDLTDLEDLPKEEILEVENNATTVCNKTNTEVLKTPISTVNNEYHNEHVEDVQINNETGDNLVNTKVTIEGAKKKSETTTSVRAKKNIKKRTSISLQKEKVQESQASVLSNNSNSSEIPLNFKTKHIAINLNFISKDVVKDVKLTPQDYKLLFGEENLDKNICKRVNKSNESLQVNRKKFKINDKNDETQNFLTPNLEETTKKNNSVQITSDLLAEETQEFQPRLKIISCESIANRIDLTNQSHQFKLKLQVTSSCSNRPVSINLQKSSNDEQIAINNIDSELKKNPINTYEQTCVDYLKSIENDLFKTEKQTNIAIVTPRETQIAVKSIKHNIKNIPENAIAMSAPMFYPAFHLMPSSSNIASRDIPMVQIPVSNMSAETLQLYEDKQNQIKILSPSEVNCRALMENSCNCTPAQKCHRICRYTFEMSTGFLSMNLLDHDRNEVDYRTLTDIEKRTLRYCFDSNNLTGKFKAIDATTQMLPKTVELLNIVYSNNVPFAIFQIVPKLKIN